METELSKRLVRRLSILFTLVAVIFMFASLNTYAASVKNATGLVNSKSGAYLRKTTSSSSKKVKLLKNNTKLTIKKVVFTKKTSTAKKYKWYQVTASGKSGYIRSDLVDTIKYTTVKGKITSKVNYRVGAGTKMKKKGSFKKGKEITIYLKAKPVSSTKGSSSTWYMVKVGSKKYYICSKQVKLLDPPAPSAGVATNEVSNPAGTIKVPNVDLVLPATGQVNSSNGINVRASASTNASIVTTLPDNKYVTINKKIFVTNDKTSAENVWYKISTDGKTGYIRSDLIDNIQYNSVTAKTSDAANYRVGAGTSMKLVGTLAKGTTVTVRLEAEPTSSTNGGSSKWYMIQVDGKNYYTCSTNIDVTSVPKPSTPEDEATFKANLKNQGFPDSYITKLVALHKIHPNWKFTAKNCGSWTTAVAAENTGNYSLIQRSGSDWVAANKTEVSYYMDPRNFLNEERVFMFEKLSYDANIHKESVVNKVLSGTKLATYGFKGAWFVTYGKQYNVSPVHLASRARQETGGGSIAIDGTGKYKGTVVYNPFNIGAYETVQDGLKYAYNEGWTTKEKSIKGGAEFIASGYINAGQDTMYSQKFNIVNSKASHQYMQNIKAPYSESYSTYASYVGCGILYDGHTFVVPVYSGMPSSTKL